MAGSKDSFPPWRPLINPHEGPCTAWGHAFIAEPHTLDEGQFGARDEMTGWPGVFFRGIGYCGCHPAPWKTRMGLPLLEHRLGSRALGLDTGFRRYDGGEVANFRGMTELCKGLPCVIGSR